MKKGIGILLLAIIASVLFCTTSATNVMCINAKSTIKKLMCDGVDYTGLLENAENAKQCDCIKVPVCNKIAVKAIGVRGQKYTAGIQVCQAALPTPYRDWVCAPAARVRGKSWSDYTYNMNSWKPAHTKRKCSARCHGQKFLQCRSSRCFWNAGIPAPAVDCIREQCEDECNSCVMKGPGECDPGMCRFGSGFNVRTNHTRCNRRCRVNWKAWGWTTNPTGNGYIKLTDVRSRSTDTFQANKAGYYIAIIDMKTCTFSYKNYTTWNQDGYNAFTYGLIPQLFGDMTGPTTQNVLVDLAVGGMWDTLPPGQPSFSPFGAAHLLGTNALNYFSNTVRFCESYAVFTGINNGPNTMTAFDVTVPEGSC